MHVENVCGNEPHSRVYTYIFRSKLHLWSNYIGIIQDSLIYVVTLSKGTQCSESYLILYQWSLKFALFKNFLNRNSIMKHIYHIFYVYLNNNHKKGIKSNLKRFLNFDLRTDTKIVVKLFFPEWPKRESDELMHYANRGQSRHRLLDVVTY